MSSLIDSKDGRKKVQTALAAQNFYHGAIDGVFGPQSVQAIIDARKHYGLSPVATFDTDLERELGLLAIQTPAVVGSAALGGLDIGAILKLISLFSAISKGNLIVDSKPWYQSTTVWASLLSVAGTILSVFHVNFGPADQATVATIIEQAVAGIGALIAIWGRLRATTTLTATK